MMVWSHADRIKLLSIIELRPWHWNRLDFYYTDNDYKENDFEEIAKLMEKSANDCQRNWRSMKVCYYRMLRNGKMGKSERTKELAKKSSFLKESFELITIRPKRRANSKTNKPKNTNDTIIKKEEVSTDYIKDKPDNQNVYSNKISDEINYPNYDVEINNDKHIVSESHLRIKRISNRKKRIQNNKLWQVKSKNLAKLNPNDDKNFDNFGQFISKQLRTMHVDIAHDTMLHIHNIIYEQQKLTSLDDHLS